MSPNHWSQLQTRFLLHFHYKILEPIVHYIYTTFSLHFHHIYMSPNHFSQLQTSFFSTCYYIFTTFTCHQTIGANYKLDYSYNFTTKLLEPIINGIYTTFSLYFHNIYMSPNHWSQLQTRFLLHFHYKTIGTNCKLHLNHIFTIFTCHQTIGANYKLNFRYIFTTKLLEPIVNYILNHIMTIFSPHLHVTKPFEPITN